MTKNRAELRDQFEKLSSDIQKRQKEENYLENDIEMIRNRLEELQNSIQSVTKTVVVDASSGKNIQWGKLISIVEKNNISRETNTQTVQNDIHGIKPKQKKIIGDRYGRSSEPILTTEETVSKIDPGSGKYFCITYSFVTIVIVYRDTVC